MQHVEVTRLYAAPPERVWAVYSDHAGWKSWAGFSKSWLETEGKPDKNGVGCVRGFGSPGFAVFEEVLEFEPPRRLAYRIVRGGLPIRDHWGEAVVTADAGGTRITWRCRFESKIPGLGWALRLFIERFFRSALEGLARRHFPDA